MKDAMKTAMLMSMIPTIINLVEQFDILVTPIFVGFNIEGYPAGVSHYGRLIWPVSVSIFHILPEESCTCSWYLPILLDVF
jgi:hypothetical protein